MTTPPGESADPIRPTIDVASAPGGWPAPWPNVAELAAALPADRWTLVGGLMTQLHAVRHGLGVVRATNDVDIVLHIEASRGVPNTTAAASEGLGYRMRASVDPRDNTAHRFERGNNRVDLVTAAPDVVDVLISDHPAPSVVERLRGRDMIRIEGGTQALRRTVNACIEITPGTRTTVSVPNPFGALILKAAAFTTDSRDPHRHLFDAAVLLACVEDPFAERSNFAGSDRGRIATLTAALPDGHPAWRQLSPTHRSLAEAALRILSAVPT